MIQKNWMLKSQDSFGKYLEFISMEVEENEGFFYYRYDSKLGKCKIFFDSYKKELTLEREGEEKIKVKISEGKNTEMRYHRSSYEVTFLVEGIFCQGTLTSLEFSYRLLEHNGDIINQISVQMKRRIEK